MASGDRTNKIAIELHAERCLHARSVWGSCSLCSDSCPGGAITIDLSQRAPQLNALRCMQCGQCLTACPLEVFESSSFTERQLVNRIERQEYVRIRCFLPYGQLESLSQEDRSYQLGTCLAALSPGVLFELALSRACELFTDHCATCRLFTRLAPTFESNVTCAFRMLQGTHKASNLHESTPLFLPQVSCNQADRKPLEVRGARPSIRALFHGSRRAVGKLSRTSALVLRQKGKHVPAWRKRLQDVWGQQVRGVSSTCNYAWPELVVNQERCRACGVCMQMCPTGTICHSLDEGEFSYSFVPGTCVDCGLCLAVCPEHALSRDYRAFPHPFRQVDRYRRAAGTCERCGMPVLQGQGETLCPVCSAEMSRESLTSRIRAQLGVVSPGDAAKLAAGVDAVAVDADAADGGAR
ncbi:4Fe-4S dicluster domain-containing protein [Adlercreutzia sp. ZJ141]|uniref:4Fe-4S dicluster domain-containing protein n=1 Tax=Adlercreutzia sp. ZJ141 TaxID=2709406 RepID=UPI0013EB1350|nr:4Fe-4S binding protein [Adlercreutzia sp. ZJ141]